MNFLIKAIKTSVTEITYLWDCKLHSAIASTKHLMLLMRNSAETFCTFLNTACPHISQILAMLAVSCHEFLGSLLRSHFCEFEAVSAKKHGVEAFLAVNY